MKKVVTFKNCPLKTQRRCIMKPGRNCWEVIAGLILVLALLAGCSENKTPYTPKEEGSIVGTVEPKDCGAKVVVVQPKPVDSTWVD